MNGTISRRSFAAAAGVLGLAGLSSLVIPGVSEASEATAPIEAGGFTLLPYTHYASGGVTSDLYAVILFENTNKTFTRYQVAYTSCTCRDAASNYRSVVYVELLNTKDTPEEAAIRSISFATNKDVLVGMWGDSSPIHGQPDYTADYMNEQLVQKLVGTDKAHIDAWQGYGNWPDALDADTLSGATVSTSNLLSLLQSLCSYHADKYYSR